MSRKASVVSVFATIVGVGGVPGLTGNASVAVAQPGISVALGVGADQDRTAIGRFLGGGFFAMNAIGVPRLAVEGHVGFEGFLRLDGDRGVAARSFTAIDLGARYAFLHDRFAGPYLSAGAGFGLFTGDPRERKVVDAPEVCESVAGMPDDCSFNIDKNISVRGGFGWGFATSDSTTVAVRIDVTYWLFSVSDKEDQAPGSTIVPRRIPRPQDTWSVLLGLEFVHWP